MLRDAHTRLAEKFGVHPTTARGWIYRGLIGRRAEPGEVIPEGRGRPPRFIVTAQDVERFQPPDVGRPTLDDELKRASARRMKLRGLGIRKIASRLQVSREQVAEWTADIPVRPRRTSQHSLRQSLRRDCRIAVAQALRATGSSWADIARALRVHIMTVHAWRKAGLLE